MGLRIKSAWASAAAMASAWMVAGCQEPKEVVMMPPPGLENQVKYESKAVAQGEQAVAEANAAKQNKVKTATSSPPTPIGQSTKTASGLVYETLTEGTGAVAKSGQIVKIHYTGTLDDGSVFDSSRTKGKPFETPIGVGRVIGGWDEGVPGMKIGERRKLVIPPQLAYGARGEKGIPPNATLTFDVELLDAQ